MPVRPPKTVEMLMAMWIHPLQDGLFSGRFLEQWFVLFHLISGAVFILVSHTDSLVVGTDLHTYHLAGQYSLENDSGPGGGARGAGGDLLNY